jgi:tetratricopeptide (TPR) repeat protein
LALAEKGDYDLAIADYTRALEIAPKYSNAYGNRIMAYTKKGEFDKAWEDMHRAETLGLTVNQKVVQGLRDASGREN